MNKFKIGDRVRLKTKSDNPEMIIESFTKDPYSGKLVKDHVDCTYFDLLHNKETRRFHIDTLELIG